MRIKVDGKQFALDGTRWMLRGTTYGTFSAREDGALVPVRDQIKIDLTAMADAGFTALRTYTAPPEDLLEVAGEVGLRVLAGTFWPDWRYLVGLGRRDFSRVVREARTEVRSSARRWAGDPRLLGVCLGNEIPADVIRWYGTRQVAGALSTLVETVREVDPDLLVTYATYPTTEYLPTPDVDFLTVNVFLERQADLRRYLTRLHTLAGDRPLVLGETGLHAGPTGGGLPDAAGEQRQAEVLDWELATVAERGLAGSFVFSWTDEWAVGDVPVEGWHFGLTRADRSPRPALAVAERWNSRTVRDVREDWPAVSVVVCAYQAEATLEECLRECSRQDYPDLDILVVDDGSTDTTASIAAAYTRTDPRVRLLTLPHEGLSVARNAGWQAATGDLVVYLDSDAYPTPEWLYYLVLGLDGRRVGGVGGPNVPPVSDGPAAQRVARAPGGPVHVLLTDDRAEHVPGCNMAFWKPVLAEVGGFDAVYTAAGDDVDLCWKVLDRGYEIGFHPAALVWHHRRASARAYLRQQRGYGRAETLVEQRHPDRFTPLGTARWRGRIYDAVAGPPLRQRVYRGLYGSAAYQSVYGAGGHTLDILHQVGAPIAVLALLTSPLALLAPLLLVVPALGALLLVTLFCLDVVRIRPPRGMRHGRRRFRLMTAGLHVAQPVVRTEARMREQVLSRRSAVGGPPQLPAPVLRARRGVVVLPADRPRAEVAAAVVSHLRSAGRRVAVPSGWESYDAKVLTSVLSAGELVSSAHPEGCVQLRLRWVLRRRRCGTGVAGTAVLMAVVSPWAGLVLGALAAADLVRGAVVCRRGLRRAAGVGA